MTKLNMHELINSSFAQLHIKSAQQERRNEESDTTNEVVAMESITTVRRRFIHIKSQARNRWIVRLDQPVQDTSILSNDFQPNDTTEEAGFTIPPPPFTMMAIIWNCRGFGHPSTRRSLRHFIVTHRPNLIFLAEIKCNQPDIIQTFLRNNGFGISEYVPLKVAPAAYSWLGPRP